MARGLLVPVAVAALAALAGLAYGRIFSAGPLPLLLVGAAAAGVAISTALRRAPSWLVAPVSTLALAAYTVLGVALTLDQAGSGDLLSTYVDAVGNCLPRLLTATIPIDAAPDTVIVPIVSVWLAGLLGAELAVRGGHVLAGFLAPTSIYAGALVVVGPNATPTRWHPLAYAAVVAVGLLAGRGGDGAVTTNGSVKARPAAAAVPAGGSRAMLPVGARIGRAMWAAGGLAVLAALTVAIGPRVADAVHRQPIDPRQYVQPPRLDTLDENPLVRLSGWAQNPRQPLLDADVSAPARLRLGVLNDFDGVTWQVGADYRAAGRVLPPPAAPALPTVQVRQRITIRDLDGRLLPAVDAPRRLDGVRFGWDKASGTLIEPDGLHPGVRYQVLSAQRRRDVNLLSAADVPAGPAVARYLRLGDGAPPELEALARRITDRSGGPYQRASLIEQFLAEHFRFAADAPSGHAYPNLEFFLLGRRDAGGQRGTSEQFACSFAVLGRMLGLPTRVVVGFRAQRGEHVLRAGDALAWPEVLFDGLGWVPFDPLPQAGVTPRPPEDEIRPEPEKSEKRAPQPTPEQTTPPATPSASAKPPAAAGASGPPATAAAAGGGGLLGLLLAIAATLLLLRRRRSKRRLTRGTASDHVAGAWLEVLDAMRLSGRRPPPQLAATEVADLAAQAVPGHPEPLPSVRRLAESVNVVGFAPDLAAAAAAHGARDSALNAASAYVAELRRRRSWWRRWWWSLSPHPLLWRGTPPSRRDTASAGSPPPTSRSGGRTTAGSRPGQHAISAQPGVLPVDGRTDVDGRPSSRVVHAGADRAMRSVE